jgi:2-dehydro-3-deoxyphosphogluconate aldolase/(4S)-4-hydroxy-2-oxoglutarate aldolase
MTPSDFVAAFREARGAAIIRTTRTDTARSALDAAVRGGFRVCEITLTTPGAMDLIREFASRRDLVVGAGTVLTPAEAQAAVTAGASFLVSPVVDEAVIAETARLGVAMMPGCATPTEMLRAHRAGAALQKLFPAAALGPAWITQTLGPLPFLKIVPTQGVTMENAPAYLRAGAHALGFGPVLFDASDLAAGRYDAIEARARALVAALRAAV